MVLTTLDLYAGTISMHYPLNYYSKPENVNNKDCMLMQHRRFAFHAVIQLRTL